MPQGWEWLLLLAVVLLLFGSKKLPEMARSIGQSARVLKGEMKGFKQDDAPADAPAPQAPPAALPQPPPAPQPEAGPATAPKNTEHTA